MRHAGILILFSIAAGAQTGVRLDALEWRSIGPAATGGRIADLAVARVAGRADEIYVATTSGGVFKSSNAGVSFAPVFDRAGGMMSIGAVAVAPSNPSVVWVGTGEADNRQSSSWGDGVYRSTDGGGTWEKMGLAETRHIGRIVVHPTDPNTVYVAAVGHLWGSNAERGVFKTTDGGKTWKRILYVDENTGATDLAMDRRNPNVVLAAMYQRQRKGWGFNGGGPGSGIYRTTDGGATWNELKNGLPRVEKGRIGLAMFEGDSRVVYATVEADPPGGRGGRGEESGEGGGRSGAGGPPQGGVYRSADQGETWERMSSLNPRPSYYSRIVVDPRDAARVYVMGSNRGLYVSDDAGRNFRDVFSGVHGEDHAMWVDPADGNHLLIGGDGGVSISWDRGQTWLFRINLPIGQFYNISTNNAEPFLVCGGLQDNGSWCTPSATNIGYGISFKDAFNIGSGDGMHAQFEGDDHTLLVSSQNGVTGRLDLRSMERQSVGPVAAEERPQPGRPAYRWYWTTPLIVSRFTPNTIYTGANVLFRSEDRGVSWKAISPDLTGNLDRDKLSMMGAPVGPRALSRHDGQSNFSALTAIAESPLERGVLYTGADDGTLEVTRDGGHHWTDLTARVAGLPPSLNISGIAPSKYAAGRVYLTVDGHFNDDYRAYVFASEDYGQSWRPIASGLASPVHRIREHPSNPDVLAVGTEMGVYGTFDRGAHWMPWNFNMPPVPVYDLVFQERSGALVLGTHGRGIWVLDHAEPLGQMTPEATAGGGHLFPVPAARHQVIYPGQFWFGAGEYFAPNPPYGAVVTYYLPTALAAGVKIAIADAAGNTVRTLRGPGEAGMNRTCWDLRMDAAPARGQASAGSCGAPPTGGRGGGAGPLVLPGRYKVTAAFPGLPAATAEVTVLPEAEFTISDGDRKKRFNTIMTAYKLEQQLGTARETGRTLAEQIASLRQAGGADPAIAKAAEELARALRTVVAAAASAASVQAAMDGYAGLPTAAQLRQLEWAREDTAAGIAALNRVIRESMPAAYAAGRGRVTLAPVAPLK